MSALESELNSTKDHVLRLEEGKNSLEGSLKLAEDAAKSAHTDVRMPLGLSSPMLTLNFFLPQLSTTQSQLADIRASLEQMQADKNAMLSERAELSQRASEMEAKLKDMEALKVAADAKVVESNATIHSLQEQVSFIQYERHIFTNAKHLAARLSKSRSRQPPKQGRRT